MEEKAVIEDFYEDMCDTFNSHLNVNAYSGIIPGTLQNNWLFDKMEMQTDERLRIIALMPLIKYEVENKRLSPELEEELCIYYEDFSKGLFQGVLSPRDYKLIEKDLNWCYENYPGTQYKEENNT